MKDSVALTAGRRLALLLAGVLMLFGLAAYGRDLSLPFLGDDYVILDKTRHARFLDLWSLGNTDFRWWRPWSREVHFWALQHLFGLHEAGYRVFSLILWTLALVMFGLVVRRIASSSAAVVAMLGAAGMAMWGTPVLWISGAQDLWMLCFAMLSLRLFIDGRSVASAAALGFALLSKETAAVLPLILTAYLLIVERSRVSQALRRTWPGAFVTLAWVLVHPTLRSRLTPGAPPDIEAQSRPSMVVVIARTLAAPLNLDAIGTLHGANWSGVALGGLAALILVAAVWLLARYGAQARESPATRASSGSLVQFGLAWALIGWLPLMQPSISWHAYYGCLGALGAWLTVGVLLRNRPRVAVALFLCMGLLRGAQASALSWDWGTEWYQKRAGQILESIREDLLRQHPKLPPHSRVYLGHVPNNIGLVAGQSPALRVWYRDTTLRAGFYSNYRPRGPAELAGDDYFFRVDTLSRMVEVHVGVEDVARALRENPRWEQDHLNLAMLFLRSGDIPNAAGEFEKLSTLPQRADAAIFAAVCEEELGQKERADSLKMAAAQRLRLPRSRIESWAASLRDSLPGR